MIHSNLVSLYLVTSRLIRVYLNLSICLACSSFIFPNYTAAEIFLPQESSNQDLTDQTTSFSFIVWGHPRGAHDGDPPLLFDEFSDLVRDLKPDFIVITGDMIQGRIGRIEEQKILLGSDWEFPYIVCPATMTLAILFPPIFIQNAILCHRIPSHTRVADLFYWIL